MSVEKITNYLKVNDQLITGGQPTEEQIRAAADDGVKVVINLATINPNYSLPDEAGLVQSLGMTYHFIPVEWGNPTEGDFEQFEQAMKQSGDSKILLHCAANYRATAFYALYALKNLGWTDEQAETFRADIWEGSDYPQWETFFSEMKAKVSSTQT